jgi:hypothetical protein
MEPTPNVRIPLSQKKGNAQHIDLTRVSLKSRCLSLTKNKARPLARTSGPGTQNENQLADDDLTLSNPQQQDTAILSQVGSASGKPLNGCKGENLKPSQENRLESTLSSDEEMYRQHRSSKEKNAAVKRRKVLYSNANATATVFVEKNSVSSKDQSIGTSDLHEIPAYADSPNNSAVDGSGHTTGDECLTLGSKSNTRDSPIYKGNTFMSSSPPSPLFYEKVMPVVKPHHDVDCTDSVKTTSSLLKCSASSPLVAKQKRNQEHGVQEYTSKTPRSCTNMDRDPVPTRRSLIAELTSFSSGRLSVSHKCRMGMRWKEKEKVGDENADNQQASRSRKQSKDDPAPRSRKDTSSQLQTCPICDKKYPISIIEQHADNCISEFIQEPGRPRASSTRRVEQSLLWPLQKPKPFIVYKDDDAPEASQADLSQAGESEEMQECPICHKKVSVNMLQQHVEEELDELSSGATTSENHSDSTNKTNTRFESDIHTAASQYTQETSPDLLVDVYSSDSECSVIDLVNEQHSPTRLLDSTLVPEVRLSPEVVFVSEVRQAADVRQRERSLSPLEGFQDIRELRNGDPGYQMYFQQFGNSGHQKTGTRQHRSQTVTDHEDDGPAESSTTRRKPARNPRWSRGGSKFRRPRLRTKK